MTQKDKDTKQQKDEKNKKEERKAEKQQVRNSIFKVESLGDCILDRLDTNAWPVYQACAWCVREDQDVLYSPTVIDLLLP